MFMLVLFLFFFFFKQKTAYEMRISDWSSDVCSSDLRPSRGFISIFGEDVVTMARGRLPALRRRIGVVFQDFRLVSHLSAFDNVALPQIGRASCRERVCQYV